jgi:hypothetical protein
MNGRRVYPDEAGDFHRWEPGDYGRGLDGRWYALPPAGKCYIGCLANHTVVEHEDGTITVTPSILITINKEDRWHGYLTKGEWSEC